MNVDFVDGYAEGWVMCVPECFRQSIRNNNLDPGEIFYDSPSAYRLPWGQALKQIKTAIQIKESIPGMITFQIMKPSSRADTLEVVETKTLSTEKFLEALKNGIEV